MIASTSKPPKMKICCPITAAQWLDLGAGGIPKLVKTLQDFEPTDVDQVIFSTFLCLTSFCWPRVDINIFGGNEKLHLDVLLFGERTSSREDGKRKNGAEFEPRTSWLRHELDRCPTISWGFYHATHSIKKRPVLRKYYPNRAAKSHNLHFLHQKFQLMVVKLVIFQHKMKLPL